MILQLYPSWSQLSHLTKNENMTCNGMPEMPYVRHFWRSTQFGKNNHFEGVRVKKIIHKKYHMQKIWSKSVISALWSAESNLQRHIEGSHRALYFQSRSQRNIEQQCTRGRLARNSNSNNRNNSILACNSLFSVSPNDYRRCEQMVIKDVISFLMRKENCTTDH